MGVLSRVQKQKRYGEKITMTYQIRSESFKDPFYFGVLSQANKTINLCDAYNFKPAVSEEAFSEVQSIITTEILNFIYKLLESGVGLTEKDYQYYYDNLTGQADKRRLELKLK